ncbi:MAG: helix-turn-helix domain-containing protein [Acidiferrobacterales bacterium]|nr:helix-turn-helix domain-containing protein [Acidiferrobacterales bacterium]
MNNVVNYSGKRKPTGQRSAISHNSVIQPHDYLFRMGEKLDGIYMLNSGSVKLFRTTESGEEYITGFCASGDLIGLDALVDGVSRTSAVALDTSNISMIPFNTIVRGGDRFDYQKFIHQIGATLNRENDHTMMLSQRTADRRLAWFLIEYADGLASRGLCPTEFSLPMTRTDIAIFLGLAVETVCRELATLCDEGIVKKNRRRIEILDMARLRSISRGEVCADKLAKEIRSAA